VRNQLSGVLFAVTIQSRYIPPLGSGGRKWYEAESEVLHRKSMLGSSLVYLELSAAAKSGMKNVSWVSHVGTGWRAV
jgi:hypothetical protein